MGSEHLGQGGEYVLVSGPGNSERTKLKLHSGAQVR